MCTSMVTPLPGVDAAAVVAAVVPGFSRVIFEMRSEPLTVPLTALETVSNVLLIRDMRQLHSGSTGGHKGRSTASSASDVYYRYDAMILAGALFPCMNCEMNSFSNTIEGFRIMSGQYHIESIKQNGTKQMSEVHRGAGHPCIGIQLIYILEYNSSSVCPLENESTRHFLICRSQCLILSREI